MRRGGASAIGVPPPATETVNPSSPRPRGVPARAVAILGFLLLLGFAVPAGLDWFERARTGYMLPPPGLVLVRGADSLVLVTEHGERTLVRMPPDGEIGQPALSRDGRRLAFTYMRGRFGDPDWGGDAYVLELSPRGVPAGPPRILLQGRGLGDAIEAVRWSPDGSELLVSHREALYRDGAYAGSRQRLERVELASGERRTLATDAGDGDWSPSGREIAFVRTEPRNGRQSLRRADIDGRNERRVTDEGFVGVEHPRFSPDGATIAFGGARGALQTNDRADGWRAVRPPWDGRAAAHGGTPWNPWTLSSSGDPRQRSFLGEDRVYPAWSRTGDRLAWVTDGGVYIMDRDGGTSRRADVSAEPRGLAWGGWWDRPAAGDAEWWR